MIHEGKFYTYSTGRRLPGLVSDDGCDWRPAGSLMTSVRGDRAEVLARGGNNTRALAVHANR